MGRILVGTCSWTDPQLLKAGTFYPREASAAESRLRFYSQNFPIVEVDSSYHAIPSPLTSNLWAERTPEGFEFDVKAFSLFTNHPTKTAVLPRDLVTAMKNVLPDKPNLYYRDLPGEIVGELWRRFRAALLPLEKAHKMGLVLFQFPRWFNPSDASFDHILACAEQVKPLRCSVEFRSESWLNEKHKSDTLSFLRANNLPFVCVDEPQGFRSSVPPIVVATSDIALVRFHGHNAETWEKKGLTKAERFNWHYSEEELRGWVPALHQLASETREVHALMKTSYGDQAVVNARLLLRLLSEHPAGQ